MRFSIVIIDQFGWLKWHYSLSFLPARVKSCFPVIHFPVWAARRGSCLQGAPSCPPSFLRGVSAEPFSRRVHGNTYILTSVIVHQWAAEKSRSGDTARSAMQWSRMTSISAVPATSGCRTRISWMLPQGISRKRT